MLYATGRSGKIGHLCITTEIHFLSVHESYRLVHYPVLDHAWPDRRRLFADAVELQGSIFSPERH